MKNLLIGIASLSLFLSGTSIVLAAPFNARNNPNIVANYPDGNHTVIQPDGSIAYNQQGADVVLLNGKSENAQQWFIGENGGIHTNFKDIGSSSSCPDSWTFLGQANPSWGTYFVPGDNYCASSNSLGH